MQLALDSGPARLPPTRCASTPSESAVGASSVVEPWPPTNRIFGMTAPRTSEFFCNVRSVISLSNATRLMSQRPQREKLPASPDPLRCDVHVIKRVVWQFCNPQHTSSILEAVTVAQQNYHAIWECCSQSGNCLSQFRNDSVTHWTRGSFGQSDCVTNLMPIYTDQIRSAY